MAEEAAWYCLGCGTENSGSARFCRQCAARLTISPRQRRQGVAFLLNELEALRHEGVIGDQAYLDLRRLYREELGQATEWPPRAAPAAPAGPPPAPAPAPATSVPPPRPPPARPVAPKKEGPGWLAEQQANLLLYLGAFLIVVATLIFVSYSEQDIPDGMKMALLVIGTLLFLGAGLFCMRIPRVQQAGVVFFAIGALMVPLNFVGAYGFFFADEDVDPTGLWLAGSMASALFYGAVAMLGLGRWYPVPMVVAMMSALTAILELAGAPAEAYAGSFIALAFLFAAPSVLPLGRVTEVFGLVGYAAAQGTVPAALVAALAIALPTGAGEAGWLAASLAGALFYGAFSLLALGSWYPVPMVAALLSALGALLALADAPPDAYPISFIALAFILAAPSVLPLGRVSEAFRLVGYWAAHAIVPPALVAAPAMVGGMVAGETGWLAASLTGAVFYGAFSLLALGSWYPVPMVAALLSALGALLALADAPPDAYPISFIALAFILAAPSVLPLGRVSEAFGLVGYWAAHAIVPPALVAAPAMVGGMVAGETAWLAASLSGALFYGAVSLLGFGRWFAVPMAAALLSALGALLALADAPPEAYPGSFAALALILAAPSLLPEGRLRETIGLAGSLTGQVVVPVTIAIALVMTLAGGGRGEYAFELTTRWYLPPTAAVAGLFYWMQSLSFRRGHLDLEPLLTLLASAVTGGEAISSRRAQARIEPVLTFVALAVTGGAAITLVYALDVGDQWYGPAVAIVGWLYAGGSEGFGPRWFGQRHLGWLALGTVTVSWLCFEQLYAEFPRHGAGVHFAATAFYLGAARRAQIAIPLFPTADAGDEPALEVDYFPLPAAAGFIYAAGLTLGIGFYQLLSSLPAAETAEASDLSMAFFYLSLAIAAVAATMRWWWKEARLHTYAVALGMSLFVLLAAADAEGQVALLLAVYTGVTLALTLWEREALALPLPAVYGFFALLAAWRQYEPNDAYLPLVFSAVGYALLTAHAALRGRNERWSTVTGVLAFGYVVAAPVVGWVRLNILADPEGFVGTEQFEETVLYQTCAASLFLSGLALLIQGWLVRHLELAAGASAVLMIAILLEIGHFRPENVQAYTAPLGVYLLAGALLAGRVPDLPRDLRSLLGPWQLVGAVVLMGPCLVQSWEEGGWPYALLLLGEGLLLLSLALVLRYLWLLATSTGFVVLDALRYLFDAARALPNWVTLAVAGVLLLGAGTAILLSRERWNEWQRALLAWWNREPVPSEAE